MRAIGAVPWSDTTLSSMERTVRAVAALTTRTWRGAGDEVKAPSVATVPATSVGSTRTPPFAIVAYTLVAWTAFSDRPWPKDTVANCAALHLSGGVRMPRLSPGKSRPVGSPIPNAFRYAY